MAKVNRNKESNARYYAKGFMPAEGRKHRWLWSDIEEIVLNPERLTDEELSFKFQRTIKAVEDVRYRYKDIIKVVNDNV